MQKKPASRILRSVLISLLLVVLGVVVGGYVYVNQAGGLRRLLETELMIMAGNANVTVGEAKLGISASRQPLTVQASDIVIALDDSQIDLPSIDLKFGLASLFNGHPEAVVLRGAKLDLVRQEAGWSGSAELIFLGQIAARSSGAEPGPGNARPAAGRLGGIKRISVETDRLSLSDATGQLPKIVFADISIDVFAPDDTAVSGSMRARRLDDNGAKGAGGFAIAFDGWPGASDFRLNATASNFQTAGLAGYVDSLPPVLRAPGVLSGHLGLDIKEGQLARLNADVDLARGRFEIPAVRQDLEFDAAKLIFTYARDVGRLTITKAELDMPAARAVRFSGSVDQFHAFSPVVEGRVEANGIALRTLVENWPSSVAPVVRQAVESRFGGGVFKQINIGLQGVYDRENSQLNLSKIDLQSQFSGVRASLDAGQYRRMVTTLDGKMGLLVGAGGRLQDASLELAMKDGSMLLAGHPKMVAVEGGQMRAAMRGNKITLDSFALDFGAAGSFDMNGSLIVGDGWALQDLELGLGVPEMDARLFTALWPEWAASKTRGWIGANIPAGRVRAARLALSADLDTPDEVRKIHAVSGDLQLRGAQLIWQKGAPPLTKVDADLHWDNDEFTATFLNGRFGGVAVQRGRMVIAPVLERVTKNAALTFTAKGDMKTALEIAGHVGIRKFGGLDFATMDASGEVAFALEASIPLGKAAPLRRTVKKFDMTVSKGRFNNLPRQMTLDNAELVLNIGEASSQITGTAKVYGAASSFSLEIDHHKNRLELVGQAPSSARLARALATITGMEIGGKIGGKLVYSGDPNIQDASLSLALDLSGTSVAIPQINWTKRPDEDGRATLSLGLRNGVLTKLTDIDINAGSLSAVGQVIFGASGQVQAALFERAVWPGNDLQGLIIESGAQSSWKVGATARRVDLSQIRRNQGASGGKAIEFDFTGDQIVIDDVISLSGQLVGKRDRLGAGTVEFLGTLLVKDKPLIAEAKLDMRFGPAGETMVGAGLIGGAEAGVDFRAIDGADPQLVIESGNAGRVLAGLGVTETVRGGRLRMTTSFKDAKFSDYDTEIRVSKFSIVEAPRALRLFSVLSPVGLYSLVEGDGTAFRHGQAIFETRGKIVKITSLMGTGDAVAVRVVGLYDRANGKIDVSGNLVPASLLNRFLTGLPIIGNLITGTDNSGVLVTQFKMTGPIDNPKTKVNPVSSLAPGVLRDLVAPDWIAKEEKRLFGDGAADATPPPQSAQ